MIYTNKTNFNTLNQVEIALQGNNCKLRHLAHIIYIGYSNLGYISCLLVIVIYIFNNFLQKYYILSIKRIHAIISLIFSALFFSLIEIALKGIVHFEMKIWYLSAYPKGIQDVGVFFSSVDPILMFLGQTVLVCQSYNGRYRSLSL